MRRTLKIAIASALLLAAGHSWALGLGQIEVKSRRNQPLLAEIPIISTTPGELEALQARLASPETFRRVGLAPPSGLTADLQFSLGNDSRGRPVIRVTTLQPVDQAVLNFLIEVDWGQGRLVREYAALVDTPNTAGAAVQPVIQAPVVQAPNVVQRPVVATSPEPVAPVAPLPAATELPTRPAAVAVTPQVDASGSGGVATGSPAQYGPVRSGETLSKIAGVLGIVGANLDQTMLALLRANPDAFLADDINRLKRGAVLRVPAQEAIAAVDADEARQVVRQQMSAWREARRAVRQPDAAAVAATRADAPGTAASATPRASAAPAAPTAARVGTRRSDARLEIVPPSAPGTANGTRSGTTAGGEGSMLQQQLRQKDEDIAAKSAEINELKERVAELEKLRADQQSLIAMKDTELATAQQRLATANAAKPAATAAAAPPPTDAPSNGTAFVLGGIGLAIAALLAWAWRRRRPAVAAKPVKRSVFDSEALAASMAPPRVEPVVDADAVTVVDPVDPPAVAVPAAVDAPVVAVAPIAPPAPAVTEADVPRAPTWHSGWKAAPASPAVAAATPRFLPLEEIAAVDPATASPAQRLKLAHAFLDVGDEDSARRLLLELLDDRDPAAREDAARVLRELG